MPRWLFVLAFALVFYGNGAGFIETAVNYPSWHIVGAGEFPAYHRFIGPRVIAFLVAPAVVGTLFTMLLLRFRPAGLPAWSIWTAVLLQVVVWVSTVTIQIPMQLQLGDHGYSAAVVDRLIDTSWWLRRLPYAACAVLFVWMGARLTAPRAPG